jgi:hypothetical protein
MITRCAGCRWTISAPRAALEATARAGYARFRRCWSSGGRAEAPGVRVMALAGSTCAALFFSSFSAIGDRGCRGWVATSSRGTPPRRHGRRRSPPRRSVAALAAIALHTSIAASPIAAAGHPQALNIPTCASHSVSGDALRRLCHCRGAAARARIVAPQGGDRRKFSTFVDVATTQHAHGRWRPRPLIAGASPHDSRSLAVGKSGGCDGARRSVLTVGALPTLVIDLYNTQDTGNRRMGPGFRWTVVLSNDELAAIDWIRRYTPEDALVQVEPEVRGRDTWAYIPAFAERRMAAGLPISMVPVDKYVAASRTVTELYRMTDAHEAFARGRALGIQYLVIGPAERAVYPQFESMLDAHPEYFRPVFGNASMRLYLVEHE